MKTHFQVTIHIASMEDYGVVSLNGEEALIVCSETVGELATSLHHTHIFTFVNTLLYTLLALTLSTKSYLSIREGCITR